MKNKQVRKLFLAMAAALAVSNVTPVVAFAEGGSSEEDSSEEESSEDSETESSEESGGSSGGMSTTETKNEDGSTTTKYEYKEEVKADSLADAVEKAQEKTEEQEKIKSEIEAAGGSYDYKVEIEENSTTESKTDTYDTEDEAQAAVDEKGGTITTIEGETSEGLSSSQDGFESEEEAQKWADEEAKRLQESQTSGTSEKVETETSVSQVEGTGITVEETKDIETKVFDTEEEAKEYAEGFNKADYEITEVNGKWKFQKKTVTATDEDGKVIRFDSKEEAEKYIEDNQAEGAFLETIEIVDTDTEKVRETVVITATSYEDFVAKVNALYAEAAADENVTILEDKADVLENYKTSVNFEKLTEEQKKELMEQMEEDAKDQNYTYTHLDLQTETKMTVYDDEGNASEVNCTVKNDGSLKVYVFAEIDGKMTQIAMKSKYQIDPQGYIELQSKNHSSLNLSKAFVKIEGTLVYKDASGKTKEAPFSTIGYLNNDYNTCSQKPGQGRWGKPSTRGGFDIELSDLTMDNEGKVTIESSATKHSCIK